MTPPRHVRSDGHLLVDEPQRVLDVRVLESDGRGGALEQLHEQAVEEPDWGEDHVAQLKRQDGPTRSARHGEGPAPCLFLERARWFTPPGFCSHYAHCSEHLLTRKPPSMHFGTGWEELVTESRLTKSITALLSPFPPRYRDKESYITEHVSLFTLAARKLGIIVHKKTVLDPCVSVLSLSLSSFSQFPWSH